MDKTWSDMFMGKIILMYFLQVASFLSVIKKPMQKGKMVSWTF